MPFELVGKEPVEVPSTEIAVLDLLSSSGLSLSMLGQHDARADLCGNFVQVWNRVLAPMSSQHGSEDIAEASVGILRQALQVSTDQ